MKKYIKEKREEEEKNISIINLMTCSAVRAEKKKNIKKNWMQKHFSSRLIRFFVSFIFICMLLDVYIYAQKTYILFIH